MADYPTAEVAGLFATTDSEDFFTASRPELELDFDGIVGEQRHRGRTRLADVRSKGHVRGKDVVLNTRQVSLIDDKSLENIGDYLEIDEAVVQGKFETTRQKFLARCLGANVLLANFRGTEYIPEFYDLPYMTDFGPYNPDDQKFDATTIAVTSYNPPCIDPGRKIEQYYPLAREGMAQAFVRVAEHQRGFVGMVSRAGKIAVGQAVLFRPTPPV